MKNALELLARSEERFHGIYRAEVTNADDLESGGRAQVRVWPMMMNIDVDVLPWAAPAFGLLEGGEAGSGAYTVPAVESHVFVFFEAGDVMHPVYFAAAPAKTHGPSGKDPEIKVWKTRSGHTITINDKSGSEQISVVHANGEKIVLTDDAVQLGKGTLRALMDERAADTFKAHKHSAGTYLSAAPGSPVTGISGTPDNDMDSDITEDTKAS